MNQFISLSSLPSKGEFYFNKDFLVSIPLYTFKDILEYNNYVVANYIHQILRDIDTLNIENSGDILLFDLPALSFLKKCMSVKTSVDFNFNFICSECGHKFIQVITLNEIDFKTGLELPKTIKINEDELIIKYPTLNDVKQVARLFLGYRKLPPMEIFLLACYLDITSNPNRIKHLIDNATHEDVVKLLNLIDNLDPLLPNKISCNQCSKESVVKLSALTTDLFSLFRINY
jgi:hypothetical protein